MRVDIIKADAVIEGKITFLDKVKELNLINTLEADAIIINGMLITEVERGIEIQPVDERREIIIEPVTEKALRIKRKER